MGRGTLAWRRAQWARRAFAVFLSLLAVAHVQHAHAVCELKFLWSRLAPLSTASDL